MPWLALDRYCPRELVIRTQRVLTPFNVTATCGLDWSKRAFRASSADFSAAVADRRPSRMPKTAATAATMDTISAARAIAESLPHRLTATLDLSALRPLEVSGRSEKL